MGPYQCERGEYVAARGERADFHRERARQVINPSQRLQAEELCRTGGAVVVQNVHVAAGGNTVRE